MEKRLGADHYRGRSGIRSVGTSRSAFDAALFVVGSTPRLLRSTHEAQAQVRLATLWVGDFTTIHEVRFVPGAGKTFVVKGAAF